MANINPSDFPRTSRSKLKFVPDAEVPVLDLEMEVVVHASIFKVALGSTKRAVELSVTALRLTFKQGLLVGISNPRHYIDTADVT